MHHAKIAVLSLATITLAALSYGAQEPAMLGCCGVKSCGGPCTMASATTQPSAKDGKFGCPMCPDVASDKPGKCPHCGMKLEPKDKPSK